MGRILGWTPLALPRYGLGYARKTFLNFNVEISVICAFYKCDTDENINFQHSREGQLSLLSLPAGAHVGLVIAFNSLKCSDVRQLHLKVFHAIEV